MNKAKNKPGFFKQFLQVFTGATQAANGALEATNNALDDLNHSLGIKNLAMKLYGERCHSLRKEWATLKSKSELIELQIKASNSNNERTQLADELSIVSQQLKDIEIKKDILNKECELEATKQLKISNET